jgi:hypothetical protein
LRYVAHSQCYEVAPSQFAVQSEVEERQLAGSLSEL